MIKRVAFILVLLLTIPIVAAAESREIIAEGTYVMGDGETPFIAQERALYDAKRTAVEQAGTYLESFSEVKDSNLTVDEIYMLASGLVETTVLEKRRELLSGEALKFTVKVRCFVDSDGISTMKDKVRNKLTVEEYQKLKRKFQDTQTEMVSLKQQLAAAKTELELQVARQGILRNEKEFAFLYWGKQGLDARNLQQYDNAISYFTTALSNVPKETSDEAITGLYFLRAMSYFDKGPNHLVKALEDLEFCLSSKPKPELLTRIYFYKAFILKLLGRNTEAEEAKQTYLHYNNIHPMKR